MPCASLLYSDRFIVHSQLTHLLLIGKNIHEMDDLELPFFGLAIIVRATDNFSYDNMLGEGGYGPVYKVIFQH